MTNAEKDKQTAAPCLCGVSVDDKGAKHLDIKQKAACPTCGPNLKRMIEREPAASVGDAKPQVRYKDSLEEYERPDPDLTQGALAVLSNLMILTNATNATFEIENDVDGKFVFQATRGDTQTPQPTQEQVEFTKEQWLVALCAWNNVPCDNEAMKKYTDENWGKLSVEGWKRVVAALAEIDGREG